MAPTDFARASASARTAAPSFRVQATSTRALQYARIDDGGFLARIGADEQDRIRFVDAGDGRVEQVGAAMRGIELRAVLTAIDVRRAERSVEVLQRLHGFGAGEIACNGGDPLAVHALEARSDGSESLVPCGGAQAAILTDIRRVEALRLEAIPDEARLVRNPLLVHIVVETRKDAHDFGATCVDADVRTDGIHHVDGLGLFQLPGTRRIGEGAEGERADRAEIDDVRRQLGGERVLEIGGDLHVLAAADGAEFGDARHFLREADAARAMDAARHHRLHEGAHVFFFDRALVLVEARPVDAIGHGLVLQSAFAALIADRAVERVIDEEEFHHAFAGALHLLGLRVDDHTVGRRHGA